MPEDFDAIVVGAGPSGSVAAFTMAKQGMSVLLLERGKYPGAKNMFGGTIFSQATAEIFPEFWQEAPVERPVVTDSIWIMDVDSVVQISYSGLQYKKAPYNKFTAIRSEFDRWLADKAVQAGAQLRTGACVRRCITRGRKVTGVVLADGEEIEARVVILADGVMSSLAQQLGLRRTINPSEVTLYVKEILELPPEVIESRFQLESGEGAVYGIVGFPTAGAIGKAGIWTNRSTVSVVVGGYLNDIINKRLSPLALLLRLKKHPFVRRLLAGGKTIEYLSHMIPKGGYLSMPRLYADGVMVVGDAAVMVSGRHGTDLAMFTGKFAGETAVLAKANNDYSARTLSAYQRKIDASWFMKDIRAGKAHSNYYSTHPDSDFLVSVSVNKAANRFFAEDLISDTERKKTVLQELLTIQPLSKSLSDLYDGLLHWRFM